MLKRVHRYLPKNVHCNLPFTLLQERWKVYWFIDQYRTKFSIEKMCQVLGVSRSAYYSWKNRKPSKWDVANKFLKSHIETIFMQSHRTYGSPRVAIALKRIGLQASRPRVARIMKKERLVSIRRKKFKTTTDSKHKYPIVENLLDRDFFADCPGKVWMSDITYVRTHQGWLYLTAILDLADRKVVGWSLSNNLKACHTTVPAWNMAVRNRPITQKLIFHSDQGVQYACNEFRDLLSSNTMVKRSMSRKGDCWDNAVAESFFNTLKTECVYQNTYQTKLQARVSIFQYIETWYNRNRIHTAIQMPIKDYAESTPAEINLVA